VHGVFRPSNSGKVSVAAELEEALRRKLELEVELQQINEEEKRLLRVEKKILPEVRSERREKILQLLRDKFGGKHIKRLKEKRKRERRQDILSRRKGKKAA